MYYRVAIRREGDQRDRPPNWQWQSTILSSLQTLFQFLRLYRALPQDRLQVFSSSSREELNRQLMCENDGLGSNSVPAVHFLRERLIHVREMTPEGSYTPWPKRASMFWRGDGKRWNGEQGAITICRTSSPSLTRGRKSVPGCGSCRRYTQVNYNRRLRLERQDPCEWYLAERCTQSGERAWRTLGR